MPEGATRASHTLEKDMSESSGSQNRPKGRLLRVVELAECRPGHADRADTGEKIAIVTLRHEGKNEQPLLLTIRDTQRLASALVAVLVFHDAEIPQSLVRAMIDGETCFFPPDCPDGDGGQNVAAPRKVPVRPSRRPGMPTDAISAVEFERFKRRMGRTRSVKGLLRQLGLTEKDINGYTFPKEGGREGPNS